MPICFIFAKSSTNRTVLVKTKSKPSIIQTIPFCSVKTQNSNPKLYRFSQIPKSKSFMNLSTWKLPAHHDVNPSASPTMAVDMASNNREAWRWKIMERGYDRLSLSIYQSKPTTLIRKCYNKIQIHKTKTLLDAGTELDFRLRGGQNIHSKNSWLVTEWDYLI